MASKKKIIEIIAAIKTIYSYYARETDMAVLTNTWDLLLKDYPNEVVDVAFYKCLQTCKVPPTPADVIERINDMQKANEPSPEELWNVLNNAIKETQRQIYYFRFNFTDESGISQGDRARAKVDDIWHNLPEKVKVYLANKNELISLAQNAVYEDLKYEKNRFIKTLPIIDKRIEDKKTLLKLGSLGDQMLLDKGV